MSVKLNDKMKYILKIDSIKKEYRDGFKTDMSLTVFENDIIGLLGMNGAGKSTFIDSLTGIKIKNSGMIQYAEGIGENQIAVALDVVGLYENLSAKRVNKIMKLTIEGWNESLFQNLLELFEIDENKRVADYSHGMGMLLNFSMAFSRASNVLIIDESTNGVDVKKKQIIFDLVRDYACQEKHAVIISTHILEDVQEICNRVILVEKGKIIMDEGIDSFGVCKQSLRGIING